ncbi:MAG: hypothetical protein H6622_03135 [Halobacteriovoraceae bacterium]|nr:hypothetical protein [Halobacteriovoraceae bacterium]
MHFLSLLFILFFISSCSLAPYTSTKTARTLGEGNWEIDTGFSPALYLGTSIGVSENLDVSFLIEAQAAPVIGLSGKYALLNSQDEGFSFSGLGGVFLGIDVVESSGFFIGPVLSYKVDWFETYIVTRYNWVKWKGKNLNSDQRDELFIDFINFDNIELSYMQYTFGFNFWFDQKIALNINAKYIKFFGNDVSNNDKESLLPGVGFIFRF